MWDSFFTLNEPQLAFLAGLLGMILAAITLIASVVTVQYRKYCTRELELAFKDDLLNRGLSATEIDLLWSGKHPAYLTQFLHALNRCWQYVVESSRAVVAAGYRAYTALARIVTERRSQDTEQELAFKREMLDRGLSVEEIQRLMAARQPGFVSWVSDGWVWLTAAAVDAFQWIRGQAFALSHKLSTTHSGRED